MSQTRGRTVPLTPARRLVCDWLHLSRQVPLVCVERKMKLGAVAAARLAAAPRPGWFPIFIKAFGIVSARRPELRRAYMTFPRDRLHEHPFPVALLPIERRVGDEDAVFFVQLRKPNEQPLGELDATLRRYKEGKLEDFGVFRRALRLGRWPFLVRRLVWWLGLQVSGSWRLRYFGSFGATGVASAGASSVHFLSPLTSMFAFGVIEADGSVVVRLMYDHRVLDGVAPARALVELEEVLNGEIAAELRGMARPAEAA